MIERRRGDVVLQRIIDAWPTFRGHAIEPIVRASIEQMLPDERFGKASFVTSWWTRSHDAEIDLVGTDEKSRPTSVSFVGSIKWREKARFSRQDAAALAALRPKVPLAGDHTLLLGVSANGFERSAHLDVKLDPEQLLAALGSRRDARR